MRYGLLVGSVALVGAAFPSLAIAEKKCEIAEVITLPITMNQLRPIIPVKINGRDANFVLDSGAFYSIISLATASQYGLKLANMPFGYRVGGIGGSTEAQLTTVKEFTIAGIPAKNVEFLVGGSEVGGEGLLGQNLLENFDVEYDLGHGAIRLFHTKDCDHANLAYWLKPGDRFSAMHIDVIDRQNPHTMGVAYLNGKGIKIAFDTGAFTSVLSTDAAERAGVTTESPGVSEAGYSGGLGRGYVKNYIARFNSFKIGDGEEIQNAKLRIAKIDLKFTDMLLGADFFVSHRIFVGNREHRLFLTYSGGPVFDLSKHEAPPQKAQAEAAQPAGEAGDSGDATAAAPAAAASSADSDPAEVARRGSALVARSDFQPGIALLSKAIALSPEEPEYYFRRGNAYWSNHQGDEALADFDHVIKLKEDFLPAYLPRAELQLWKQNKPAAMADLDAVDRLAPKPADLRFTLAELYDRLNLLPTAIGQYGLWMESHPDDSRMVTALGRRCLDRALLNQDLSNALSDCNTALRRADKKNPNSSHLLVDRAVVRLRMGELDKAVEDCNDALKMMPKNARALYLRGIAESHKNKRVESDADIASAKSIAPKVAEVLEHFGIVP
jgi:clan AA aspartic protease (TIGR02281 family)